MSALPDSTVRDSTEQLDEGGARESGQRKFDGEGEQEARLSSSRASKNASPRWPRRNREGQEAFRLCRERRASTDVAHHEGGGVAHVRA
jgi:hypothetical protein